jgi:hypothetical protein
VTVLSPAVLLLSTAPSNGPGGGPASLAMRWGGEEGPTSPFSWTSGP